MTHKTAKWLLKSWPPWNIFRSSEFWNKNTIRDKKKQISRCNLPWSPEREYRYGSLLSLTSEIEWASGQRHALAALLTGMTDPVPIVLQDGWAPGPVWTGVENLAPTGIRSPERPVRHKSVRRLRYLSRDIKLNSTMNQTAAQAFP